MSRASTAAVLLAFPVASLLALGWFARKPHGAASTLAMGTLAVAVGSPIAGSVLMRYWQP